MRLQVMFVSGGKDAAFFEREFVMVFSVGVLGMSLGFVVCVGILFVCVLAMYLDAGEVGLVDSYRLMRAIEKGASDNALMWLEDCDGETLEELVTIAQGEGVEMALSHLESWAAGLE